MAGCRCVAGCAGGCVGVGDGLWEPGPLPISGGNIGFGVSGRGELWCSRLYIDDDLLAMGGIFTDMGGK